MSVNKVLPATTSAPNFLKQSHFVKENIANTSKGAVPKIKQSNESKMPQLLGSNIKQANKTRASIEISLNDQPTTVGAAVTDDVEMSIYFKHTPKTPKIQQHVWNESSPSPKTHSGNVYVHRDVDMNITNQVIDHINVDTNVNPFNGDLQTAFLEQIVFVFIGLLINDSRFDSSSRPEQ
ncbi:uncharacterized protein [Eurosta solidaginis]|uniref:uncharacterized protein n=1 Tax=Eurosta solidaginis TaxID=178769 RepID=UPI0035306A15